MENRLSEIFLEKKRFEAYTPALRKDVMTLEDVKIYGEIIAIETSYFYDGNGHDKAHLKVIAQEHGIKEYKL